MAQKRSKRLGVVLDLARRKQEQADRYLSDSRLRVQQAETQIQQLQAYLLEYQTQFNAQGRNGMSPTEVRTHQAFIARLQQALQQQHETLHLAQQQLQQVTRYWQETYAHTQGIEKLTDKVRMQEQAAADKRDQQEVDERSQRFRGQGF